MNTFGAKWFNKGQRSISNRVGLVRALDSFLLPTDQRNESDKNSSVSMALLAAGIWNKEMDSSQRPDDDLVFRRAASANGRCVIHHGTSKQMAKGR